MPNRFRSRRYSITSLALLALGIGIGLLARAAGGGAGGFQYSGTLKNNGVPESGSHTFAFALVDGSGNTVGCGTDTRAGLAVTNGRFDAANLFASCGTLESLLATQSSLAIRITVDGQVLTP